MKKYLFLIILFSIFNNLYAYKNCSEETSNYMKKISENGVINPYYGNTLREQYYNSCIKSNELELTNILIFNEKGVQFANNGNYLEASNYYKKFLDSRPLKNDNYYNIVKSNLVDSLLFLADSYINKNDYNKAINYYLEVITYDNKNLLAFWGLGYTYGIVDNIEKGKYYYNKALEIATNKNDIEKIKNNLTKLEEIEKLKILKKEAPTNDLLSGYQYYLKQLNIPNAWEKVINNNEVIVAIIDDGININHPDLINNIWIHPKAKYGDNKIIDFVGDGLPANLPVGEHGTMIAGIIGAKQNNKEGIAGIAKNVKFMPLRVFDSNGNAKEDNIIKAIDYAIDNGANIINLSLGASQFNYSIKYDEVIKKAYRKGVVIVIAAGNGDILSKENTGIYLSNNPISPVCNNESKYKFTIGVYATDSDGYRTNWTNYGDCTEFFAPGEEIISTSIPIYNSNYGDNYNIANGTSFSAPIITGIIALGYNQYGHINPVTIYDSLLESYVPYSLPGGEKGTIVDSSKYIYILNLKLKAENTFNQIEKKLSKLSEIKRKNTYNLILKQLNGFNGKVKGDKEIILNHLIFLVKNKL